MGAGCLPAQWRNRRRLFALQLPEPESWIDIGHTETIAAIRRVLGEDLYAATGCSEVTLAQIHSPNREVTTRIAVGWVAWSWMTGHVRPASETPASLVGNASRTGSAAGMTGWAQTPFKW